MTNTLPVDETVTVTVGLLGSAATALGTASLRVAIDPTAFRADAARAVGEAMSAAFLRALEDAVREFQPEMTKHFRDQRIREKNAGAS